MGMWGVSWGEGEGAGEEVVVGDLVFSSVFLIFFFAGVNWDVISKVKDGVAENVIWFSHFCMKWQLAGSQMEHAPVSCSVFMGDFPGVSDAWRTNILDNLGSGPTTVFLENLNLL